MILAAVLDRFFAKYVSINSFTETLLRASDGREIMRWPIRLGLRPAL
jgi:type VI secretion system protein ImpG